MNENKKLVPPKIIKCKYGHDAKLFQQNDLFPWLCLYMCNTCTKERNCVEGYIFQVDLKNINEYEEYIDIFINKDIPLVIAKRKDKELMERYRNEKIKKYSENKRPKPDELLAWISGFNTGWNQYKKC